MALILHENNLFRCIYFSANYRPTVINLDETVPELECRLGMSLREEVEETGRMFARLQD